MTTSSQSPRISVLTCTLNAARYIPRLIRSLESQTTFNFDWLVVDGGSRDGTLELVRSARLDSVLVLQESHPGIYPALNLAVNATKTRHYLVCGGDDELFPNAVELYSQQSHQNPEAIISAAVSTSRGKYFPMRGSAWFRGQLAFVSQHSVGVAIPVALHKHLGLYDESFRLAADSLFIQKAVKAGVQIVPVNFQAGNYCLAGQSAVRVCRRATETFRVQRASGYGNPTALAAAMISLAGGVISVLPGLKR